MLRSLSICLTGSGTKALATKKLQASQGTSSRAWPASTLLHCSGTARLQDHSAASFVFSCSTHSLQHLHLHAGTGGAKFSAPDCGQPNNPGAQPLRRLKHCSSSLHQPGVHSSSLAAGQHSRAQHRPHFPCAPSFAAAPIWHSTLLASAHDHSTGRYGMSPTASAQPDSKPAQPSPLQQYAGLWKAGAQQGQSLCLAMCLLPGSAMSCCCPPICSAMIPPWLPEYGIPAPVGAQAIKPAGSAHADSALSWYGNLGDPQTRKDTPAPAAKAQARSSNAYRQRMRNAYAAYAAMAP